jgi:triosephosphate isomerase (TIM)
MDSVRPVYIIGNWKMNKTIEEARQFIDHLLPHLKESSLHVGLAVPFTALYPLSQQFKDSSLLMIGAQNMNDASEGAFTGEVAGKMLKEAGAQFVLIGHSERRQLYHESDEWINRKMKRAVEINLQPILCVGETEKEHEAHQAKEVIERQLREGFHSISKEQIKNLIIAYEPVWAIGTGKSATPEEAQEMHHFCRAILSDLFSEEEAGKAVIQYGGSVNPQNAQELLDQPDIDGLLIGGASLSLESFSQIVDDSLSRI